MKKICFIATSHITLEYFVLKTATYLYHTGEYDITFICNYNKEFQISLPEYIKYHPIEMKRGVSVSGLKALIQLNNFFRKNKFDLVQYSAPNASLYASIAAYVNRIPVRLYCQWGIRYVTFQGLKRTIFKTFEKIVCSLSTRIEPDSYGNLEFSVSEGLYPESKANVIWNGSAAGVDLEKFDIALKASWRKQTRHHFNITEDTFVIGFVGRLTKDKGIFDLLQSMKEILSLYSNVKLLLIGEMEDDTIFKNSFYQWSLKQENIIYGGTTREIEKYYAAMDLLILPSYREGFGTVLIEAQAMGLPVISSNIIGPTEAMIEGETGLIINKGDPQSITNTLKKLINDRHYTLQLGENARKFVKENFDDRVLIKKIKEDRDLLISRSKE